jgi:hypothetical protein
MVSVQRIVESRLDLRVLVSHPGDASQRLNCDTSHPHPLHDISHCVPFGVVIATRVVEDLRGNWANTGRGGGGR